MITVPDVREFALTLPRTHEGVVRGRTKFYVGRIVYVAFSLDEARMGFGFSRDWRNALVENEPEKFMLPTGRDVTYNWVVARMDALGVDEMREYVLDAWGMCAPKRVVEDYLARNPIG